MCISSIMTRDDLFSIPCGSKFYVTNDEGETLEGIKITQYHNEYRHLIVADFAELGEDGESTIIETENLSRDGVFVNPPVALRSFGDDIRLCMEGNS